MRRSADLLIGAAVSLAVHGGVLGGALFLSSASVRPAAPLFPEGESSLAMTFVASGSETPAPATPVPPTAAPPAPAAPPPARIYTEPEPAEPVALEAPAQAAPPPPLPSRAENEESELDEDEASAARVGTAPAGQPAGQPAAAGAPTAADADGRSQGVAGGVRMTTGIRPVYPLGSRQRGEEGIVRLRITVSPNGQAREITVLQSSGYPALDDAAQRAVRRARFAPARQNGKPVEAQLPLNFRFRLTD